MNKITHDKLIKKASAWLRNHKENITVPNCSLTLNDQVTCCNSGEVPDVLGFCYWCSVLIEVKVSRSDFLADKKKIFRKTPALGMGDLRLYCAPKGIIKPEELPWWWGLLEYENSKITMVKEPEKIDKEARNEITMLLSKIRRDKKDHRETIKVLESTIAEMRKALDESGYWNKCEAD